MAERKIDAISIGIGADISGLRESLNTASAEIGRWNPPQKTVNVFVTPRWGSPTGTSPEDLKFKRDLDKAVGRFRTAVKKVQTDVDTGLEFHATFIPVTESIENLRLNAQKVMDQQAKEGHAITVPVAADLASAAAIHGTIQDAVNKKGPITVRIRFEGDLPGEPGGGGGTGKGGGGKKGGKKPKGGGGGAAAEPAADASPTVVATVPGAKRTSGKRTPSKPKAPVAGAIVGAPEQGAASTPASSAPVTGKAPTPPVADRPSTRKKPSELGTTTPHPDAAGGTAAALAASLTPEALENEAIARKYKELEDQGVVWAVPPGREMEWQLARKTGRPFRGAAISGIRPGSEFDQNPAKFKEQVTDVLARRQTGRRVGDVGQPMGKGRRYRAPGMSGSAARLGSIDAPPQSIRELVQLAENLSARLFNERDYEAANPKYNVAEQVTPEMRETFDEVQQWLTPYQTVIDAIQGKVANKETLTDRDLADIQNLLVGDPTKIKMKDPRTGKKIRWSFPYMRDGQPVLDDEGRQRMTGPLMLRNANDPDSAFVPSLSEGVDLLRQQHPAQFFGTVGSKKGITWVNPDSGADVERGSPGMLALATGWKAQIGVREGEGGGLRSVLKEYETQQARKQAAARRRKEIGWYKKLAGIPDEQQRLSALREIAPDVVPKEDTAAMSFLRGRMKIQREGGWAPNPRVGKMQLGGNIPRASLGLDMTKGIYQRLSDSGRVGYLEDAMREFFPRAAIDLAGSRPGNVEQIATAAELAAQNWPASARSLRGIRSADRLARRVIGGIQDEFSLTQANAFYDGDAWSGSVPRRNIYFNRDNLLDDPARNIAIQTASSKSMFHSPSWRDLGDVFLHEFGHHRDDMHGRAVSALSVFGGLPWTSIYGNYDPSEHAADAFQHFDRTGDVRRSSWVRDERHPGLLVDLDMGEIKTYEEMLKTREVEDHAQKALRSLQLSEQQNPNMFLRRRQLGGPVGMRKGGKINRKRRARDFRAAMGAFDQYGERAAFMGSTQGITESVRSVNAITEALGELPLLDGVDTEFVGPEIAGATDWVSERLFRAGVSNLEEMLNPIYKAGNHPGRPDHGLTVPSKRRGQNADSSLWWAKKNYLTSGAFDPPIEPGFDTAESRRQFGRMPEASGWVAFDEDWGGIAHNDTVFRTPDEENMYEAIGETPPDLMNMRHLKDTAALGTSKTPFQKMSRNQLGGFVGMRKGGKIKRRRTQSPRSAAINQYSSRIGSAFSPQGAFDAMKSQEALSGESLGDFFTGLTSRDDEEDRGLSFADIFTNVTQAQRLQYERWRVFRNAPENVRDMLLRASNAESGESSRAASIGMTKSLDEFNRQRVVPKEPGISRKAISIRDASESTPLEIDWHQRNIGEQDFRYDPCGNYYLEGAHTYNCPANPDYQKHLAEQQKWIESEKTKHPGRPLPPQARFDSLNESIGKTEPFGYIGNADAPFQQWSRNLLGGMTRQLGGKTEPMAHLPVFGRGRVDISPKEWGDVGDMFRSMYGYPYELKEVPIESIAPTHGIKEDRVQEYLDRAKTGSPIPPIILGPQNKVQDGHHRLEAARRLGLESQLAYVFAGNEDDLPAPLREKLGLTGGKTRQLGGGFGTWFRRRKNSTTSVGDGWDIPEPRTNPLPYQYPDDYRPGVGPTSYENHDWGRVPKAPSQYPEMTPYITDFEKSRRRRALGGGIERVGVGGQHLWDAPGPGWIIPHHLIDKMPVRKDGGKTPKNRYLVGEAGEELFIPEALGGMIPPKVMAQLPKRRDGGGVGDQAHPMSAGERMFVGMRPIGVEGGGDPFFDPMRQAHQMDPAERMINSMVSRINRPEWNPIQQAHQMAPGWEPPTRSNPERPLAPIMQAHEISNFQMELPLTEGAGPLLTRRLGAPPKPAATPEPAATAAAAPAAPAAPAPATPVAAPAVTAAPVTAAAAAATTVESPLTGSVKAPTTKREEYDTSGAPGFATGPFHMRGRTGSFKSDSPDLYKGTIGGGDIQRVFVTNWPPALSGRGPLTQREKQGFNEQAKAIASKLPEMPSGGSVSAQPVVTTTPGATPETIKGPASVRSRRLAASQGRGIKGDKTAAAGDAAGEDVAEKPAFPKGSLADQLKSELEIRRRYALENELPEIGAKITAAQGRVAARALSTGTGEAALYTFGGRERIVAKARFAAAFKGYAGEVQGQRKGYEIERNTLQKEVEKARAEGYRDDDADMVKRIERIKELTDADKVLGEEEEFATNQARDLAKGITGLGPAVRATLSNTIGITVGMTAFGAAMQVANMGIQGLSAAFGPMVERGFGFITMSSKMGQSLGDQVRQMKGADDAAIALATSQTGMSKAVADTISPLLKQRAVIEGGNKAFSEQLSMINAAGQFQYQNLQAQAGQPTGFMQPSGGIPGVSRSTGGILGTPIMATPSLYEQIAQQAGTSGGQNATRALLSPLNLGFPSGLGSGIAGLLGSNVVKTPEEIAAMSTPLGADEFSIPRAYPFQPTTARVVPSPPATGDFWKDMGSGFEWWNKTLTGDRSPASWEPAASIGSNGSPSIDARQQMLAGNTDSLINNWGSLTEEQKSATTQLINFRTSMDSLADATKKGGSNIQWLKKGQDGYNEALSEGADIALRAQIGPETYEAIKDLGYVLADVNKPGRKLTTKDITESGQSALIGGTKIDQALMVKSMMQYAIPAMLRDINRRTDFAVQRQQPAEYALRRIAEPLVPYQEDPRAKGASKQLLKGPGFDDAFKSSQTATDRFFKKYEADAVGAQKAINAQIDKGKKLLADMDIPQTIIDRLGVVGSRITEINKDLSQKQVNLSVAEYTNQIRVANRSLKDARDMWKGIHGSIGSSYGMLEGMNVRMGRQLQLLGFELQQRQINFSLATAGFVAPGTTPEERAARIEEAKIEADYAQKQLDLQKQISSNQYKQTGIGAGRNIVDLQAQTQLLQQGRALVQETNAAQAAIEKLSEERSILLEQASTFLGGAISKETAFLDVIKQIETETGPLLNAQVDAIAGAWTEAAEEYKRKFLNPVTTSINDIFRSLGLATIAMAQTRTNTYTGKPVPEGEGNASGFLGTVSGATKMIMGEAGTETVAILRSPREILAEGLSKAGSGAEGGGYAPIQVVFNNPVVREEGDIDDIVRKVEAVLMRKTTMFGLRRV